MKKLLHVIISDQQSRDLARLSKLSHISKSELVRLALRPYLEARLKEFEKPNAPPDLSYGEPEKL